MSGPWPTCLLCVFDFAAIVPGRSVLMAQQQFVSDGLTLFADVAGPSNAPTVILLHGGGQTRHSWSGAMQALATAGYHVVTYDARGHGDSDWAIDGDYSLPALARDLQAVVSAVGGPVALVGASMGGMTCFYAIGAGMVKAAQALVMVDITLTPAPQGREKILTFMRAHRNGFATIEEAVAAVKAYNPARKRATNPEGLTKNLRRKADGRLYWHWDPRLLDATPASEPPSGRADLIMVSEEVTLPTLLVRGSSSDIVDDEGVAEMLRLVPQTEVVEITGAGHMVVGDRNDVFSAAIIAFLQKRMEV